MLCLALEHKGLLSHDNPHYDLPTEIRNPSNGGGTQQNGAHSTADQQSTQPEVSSNEDEDGGVYL